MAPIYKNFIYNEERGFLFAYVPKVACTNWKSLLRYMSGQQNWLDTRLAHDKINGGLRYLDFHSAADLALLSDPDIRKFAMVRDPYSRTLSAYLNKVESRLPVTPDPVLGEDHFTMVAREIDRYRRDVLETERFPKTCLESFLLWLLDSGSRFTHDEHWTPQSVLLRQPEVKFDILGRFENLDTDAARLLEAMGCDRRFPSQKDINFSPTKATEKLASYYTPATYSLVEETFSGDFATFGYPIISSSKGLKP